MLKSLKKGMVMALTSVVLTAGLLTGCSDALDVTADGAARAASERASSTGKRIYARADSFSSSNDRIQFKLNSLKKESGSSVSVKSGKKVKFYVMFNDYDEMPSGTTLAVRDGSSESKWSTIDFSKLSMSDGWYSISVKATSSTSKIGFTFNGTKFKKGDVIAIKNISVDGTTLYYTKDNWSRWSQPDSMSFSITEFAKDDPEDPPYDNPPPPTPTDSPIKWAGVRCSDYGAEDSVGVSQSNGTKWGEFAKKVNSKFDNTTPVAIWIVSGFEDSKKTHPTAHLNFNAGSSLPSYVKNGSGDPNTSFLNYADSNGISVWLQVESGDADILKLAKLVMDKYASHKCVKGFGVDMEYYYSHRSSKSNKDYYGQQMKDQTAKDLVKLVRNYGSDKTVFLKHWEPEIMPPSYRDGLIFVIDTQGKDSLSDYRDEVQNFAKAFKGNPVMFQIGYDDDKSIWGKLSVKKFAEELTKGLSSSSYNIGIVWVDFTLQYALDH